MAATGDGLLNFLRGGASGSDDDINHSPWLTIIVVISIIVHIFDASTNYANHGITLIAYLTIIILIMGPMYHFRRPDSQEISFVFVVGAAYGLPFLLNIMPDSKWILIASAALFLFPIIALYVALQYKGGKSATLSMWWITFWIIVLLLYFIVVVNPDMTTASLKGNTLVGVKYVFTQTKDIFSKTGKTITDAVNKAIAQATGTYNPSTEESRVGIYVEDVKGIESRYTNMSNVYVEARIKAENVKELIDVNTICYIDGIGAGIVSPTMIYNVSDNYDTLIGCNFGKLNPGVYEVKVRANFQFETTSDIKYTFVNSGMKSDQFQKLNIDPQTISTYTGGPVELGLSSIGQPLRIDVIEGQNTELSTYPFGVSLKNKWTQGEVIKGIVYVLDIPKEITLVDCSRNFTDKSEPDSSTNRNTYTFKVDKDNIRDKFDAVQCRMNIKDVNGLLGSDLKSVKTFAARVLYEYAVESSTSIVVEKN